MQAADYKRCRRCGVVKPLPDFHRDRHRPDGRTSACAACRQKRAAAWNAARGRERARLKQRLKSEERVRAGVEAREAMSRLDAAFCAWFAGFTDGEGTFEVILSKRERGVNAGARFPIVRFSVCQHVRDRQVLDRAQHELGLGQVGLSAGGRLAQLRVIRQAELEILAVLFTAFPLRTAKRDDCNLWTRAVAVKRNFHLGGGGMRGANAATWAEFEQLADAMKALRATRRAG
jgi:hypothetical protein